MSDVPAAPPAAAPATDGASPAAPQTAAPTNPLAEVEAALKKAGGLKFKANGKEHAVDSLEKLQRLAQRGLPVEESLQDIARQRSEMEPIKALLEQLQGDDEEAAEAALERLMRDKFDRVAERRLRKQYEREKEMEQLSPREKELRAALEQERGEKKRLAEAQRQREEQAQKAEAERATNAVRQHIESNVVKAFELMDLPPKLTPIAVDFMKPIIRASLSAGMALDPQVLADKVRPVLQELFTYQVKSLEGEKLLSLFGDDVGRKYRQALLGRLQQPKEAAAAPEAKPAAQPTGGWDPRKMW